MNRVTISFPSVFDLHDFKKETNVSNTEARVNLLTGHFSQTELDIATQVYHAEIINENKVVLRA